MSSTWQERSSEIHEKFIRFARSKGSLMSESEIVHFLALAICGEAGELANLIKKSWRGDDVDLDQITDEIADIRIYLEHLARHLRVDIDKACEKKLEVVAHRLEAKDFKLPFAANF